MRNTFTISSIANVVSRYCAKATVMLRHGNTQPATWPHNCAGPIIFGRGERDAVEPVLLGDQSSLTFSGRYPIGIHQPLSPMPRFLEPASRQTLFQRIS